jgi:ornithine cyclodeaminase
MTSREHGAGSNDADPVPGTVMVSGSDLRRLVSMSDAVEVVEQALRERHLGGLTVAPRSALDGGRTLLMAAASPARGGVASKVVSIIPENRAAGLATIQGIAAWFDRATMRPLVITDATALTALRTGAMSGVATRMLAPKDAGVLAMIGAGGQALSLVEAMCLLRPIEVVHVASASRRSTELLCAIVMERFAGVTTIAADSVATAVRDADIVCTATTSTTPLFEAGDLKPGVHVNAVGAYRPDMHELGASVFAAAAVVYVDELEGALREAGDLIDAVAVGAISQSDLVALGQPGAGESEPAGGTTVFKSVGSAAADLAVLDLLAQRAASDDALCRVDFGA